jgi:hypothetical protein
LLRKWLVVLILMVKLEWFTKTIVVSGVKFNKYMAI